MNKETQTQKPNTMTRREFLWLYFTGKEVTNNLKINDK